MQRHAESAVAAAAAGEKPFSEAAHGRDQSPVPALAAQRGALSRSIRDAVASEDFLRAEELKCKLESLELLLKAHGDRDTSSPTVAGAPKGHARTGPRESSLDAPTIPVLRERITAAVQAHDFLLAGDLKHQLEVLQAAMRTSSPKVQRLLHHRTMRRRQQHEEDQKAGQREQLFGQPTRSSIAPSSAAPALPLPSPTSSIPVGDTVPSPQAQLDAQYYRSLHYGNRQ